MRVLRLAFLVCAVLVPALVAAPPAQATDCVTAPPAACPPGSVPWPKRTPSSCGAHGVAWTCAWLW